MKTILSLAVLLTGCVLVAAASPGGVQGLGQGLPHRVTLVEEALSNVTADVGALTQAFTSLQQTVAELAADRQPALTVVDANGVAVGSVVDTVTPLGSAPSGATVVLRRNNVLFAVGVRAATFVGSSALFFLSANCTISPGEQPYVRDNGGVFPSVAVAPPGSTVYVQDSSVDASEVGTHSFIRAGETTCTQSNNTFLSFPAVAIIDLATEFTPPYRVQMGQ